MTDKKWHYNENDRKGKAEKPTQNAK